MGNSGETREFRLPGAHQGATVAFGGRWMDWAYGNVEAIEKEFAAVAAGLREIGCDGAACRREGWMMPSLEGTWGMEVPSLVLDAGAGFRARVVLGVEREGEGARPSVPVTFRVEREVAGGAGEISEVHLLAQGWLRRLVLERVLLGDIGPWGKPVFSDPGLWREACEALHAVKVFHKVLWRAGNEAPWGSPLWSDLGIRDAKEVMASLLFSGDADAGVVESEGTWLWMFAPATRRVTRSAVVFAGAAAMLAFRWVNAEGETWVRQVVVPMPDAPEEEPTEEENAGCAFGRLPAAAAVLVWELAHLEVLLGTTENVGIPFAVPHAALSFASWVKEGRASPS